MLGLRHRNSVTKEDGMNMGRTWTGDGKRRRPGPPLVGLHRLYTALQGEAL